MATLALVTLVCLLYSCVPAISSEPLIITITKDGTDEAACLSGKVPCKTFDYAIQYVDGNGGDVTIIIAHPQQVFGWEYIYIGKNISSLIIVGQAGNDYTFTSGNGSVASMSITSNVHVYEHSPDHLRFENVHCTCMLRVTNIPKVDFKGYYNINIKLDLFGIASITIEDSTLTGLFFEPSQTSSNITIKNSSLINSDTMLSFNYLLFDSMGQINIFVEYTNWALLSQLHPLINLPTWQFHFMKPFPRPLLPSPNAGS